MTEKSKAKVAKIIERVRNKKKEIRDKVGKAVLGGAIGVIGAGAMYVGAGCNSSNGEENDSKGEKTTLVEDAKNDTLVLQEVAYEARSTKTGESVLGMDYDKAPNDSVQVNTHVLGVKRDASGEEIVRYENKKTVSFDEASKMGVYRKFVREKDR